MKTRAFSVSRLGGRRPRTVSSFLVSTKAQIYHAASTIHKTPGRHISASVIQKRPLPQRRNLSRVESDAFHPKRPSKTPLRNANGEKAHRVVPISKLEGEMILFKEVFIEPKAKLLAQMTQEQPQSLVKKTESKTEFQHITEEVEAVRQGQTFFNLMIQVQPPDGLNASVAAPLTPGGGWAPSLPAKISLLRNCSLKDLTLRARAGVLDGDVQKEAHMAFALGTVNESNGNYLESKKFFKRFFFCARLLDDPIGASLALNRLGITYAHLGNHVKSSGFHAKHCEFTDSQNKFASHYNLGIAYRNMQEHTKSTEELQVALKLAVTKGDLESEAITYGQLGVTAIAAGDLSTAKKNLQQCMSGASRLKNLKIMLDCLIVLGVVAFRMEDWASAAQYFEECLLPARLLGETDAVDKATCNLGAAKANLQLKNKQEKLIGLCKQFAQ